jgi:hypothetical protein
MFKTQVEPQVKRHFMTTSMINKRQTMKNHVRFVFYNNESIQKLAFFRFLECSLLKANKLFAAQVILARQNLHFLT